MNRIERNGSTYPPAWFDSDSHLAELVRGAEQKRSQFWHAVEIGAVWLAGLAFCWLFWWGVARAIDMARNY